MLYVYQLVYILLFTALFYIYLLNNALFVWKMYHLMITIIFFLTHLFGFFFGSLYLCCHQIHICYIEIYKLIIYFFILYPLFDNQHQLPLMLQLIDKSYHFILNFLNLHSFLFSYIKTFLRSFKNFIYF